MMITHPRPLSARYTMNYHTIMSRPADLNDPRLLRLLELLGDIRAFKVKCKNVDQRFLIGRCWYNVYAQKSRKQGEIVFGWSLWDVEHAVEAQHHAVWLSPDGNMLDITPNESNSPYTVFAVDRGREFRFETLKGWLNLKCYSSDAVMLEHTGKRGVHVRLHPRPGTAGFAPETIREWDELRELCPIAGLQLDKNRWPQS